MLGELAGVSSPASVYTPIVGAEIVLPQGARVEVPLRADWEYAIVGVEGVIGVTTGIPGADPVIDVDRQHLLYLGTGRDTVEISAPEEALIFVLGGEPFEDEIVMWWNFVGRSHEEIVDAREAWEAGASRFGHVVDHGAERVPAPPLPGVRLTRRRRRI